MQYREALPLVHNHDYYELFVVVDGSMKHFVNNKNISLREGHRVFIRPHDFHSFYFRERECHYLNQAIKDIAFECGFENQSNFHRLFQRGTTT